MEALGLAGIDEHTLTGLLEEIIEGLGVRIRYEVIGQEEDSVHVLGGLCLLRGEYVLIVNSSATPRDRIETLGKALKHFDLGRIYVRPALRDLLDKIPEQRPFDIDSSPDSH